MDLGRIVLAKKLCAGFTSFFWGVLHLLVVVPISGSRGRLRCVSCPVSQNRAKAKTPRSVVPDLNPKS